MNEERESTVRVRAHGVSMAFGFRSIFRDRSVTVVSGRPLAVTGANGSGKSTFIRVLAGVLTPTSGTVEIDVGGTRVEENQRVHTVGLVTPDLALYPPLSARETLGFLARVRGLGPLAPIDASLDRVGLLSRADDLVSTYSTGMRQRLRIATALLHDPPVLLLDEPGATLDEGGRDLIASLVSDDSRAVVVATNDPGEAALCADTFSISAREGQNGDSDAGPGAA